jgi:hypothetical protein
MSDGRGASPCLRALEARGASRGNADRFKTRDADSLTLRFGLPSSGNGVVQPAMHEARAHAGVTPRPPLERRSPTVDVRGARREPLPPCPGSPRREPRECGSLHDTRRGFPHLTVRASQQRERRCPTSVARGSCSRGRDASSTPAPAVSDRRCPRGAARALASVPWKPDGRDASPCLRALEARGANPCLRALEARGASRGNADRFMTRDADSLTLRFGLPSSGDGVVRPAMHEARAHAGVTPRPPMERSPTVDVRGTRREPLPPCPGSPTGATRALASVPWKPEARALASVPWKPEARAEGMRIAS